HGAQYLLLVTMIAGGSARAQRRLSRPTSVALLANISFIGGAVLSAASHLHNAGQFGRFAFGAYLGAVMAHFVVDAGLWRMLVPLARRFLITHLPYLVPGRPTRDEPRDSVLRPPIDRQPI